MEREEGHSTDAFVAQCESLHSLLPAIGEESSSLFKTLHDFGLQSNQPTGCILMSRRTHCRSCMKGLSVDTKSHVVVVYHLKNGAFLGSRVTKICRKCKIYEHFGFWTKDGIKHYECEGLRNDFLLISEETALDMDLLKDVSSLLVVGAVAFSTYASSYNRRFRLDSNPNTDNDFSCTSSYKGSIQYVYEKRRRLDRRRLEEGFLIFATLEVMERHGIQMPYFPFDKNELAKMVTEPFHHVFIKTWGEHSCSISGCHNVVVLDGNMKNSRQVCSCKQITQLEFEGMDGAITVGCLNTPSKASRFCDIHVDAAMQFRNDINLMNDCTTANQTNDHEDYDLLPIKVTNEKRTRNGQFYEIQWSNGSITWVKDIHLPPKLKEQLSNGETYDQVQITVKELGQARIEYKANSTPANPVTADKTFKSHGFAIEKHEDNIIQDEMNGIKHILNCGTEKGKHKSKNAKTAGILVFERPCGIVIDVRELFGSESKSQVYAHLHTLLNKDHMIKTDIICYDDACHLKKFAQNPVRSQNTGTAKRMSEMEIVCDKFHFKNHTDRWCKRNCNPYNSDGLKDVNTEVCEQLFSWLSSFAHITKHMNRWRFLFLMLYILDCHNYDLLRNN